MIEKLYRMLTTYPGMYVLYLIPIAHFGGIILKTVVTNLKQKKPIGAAGMAAVIAIVIIVLDFGNYLYLFFSGTGTLLPSRWLFVKYVIGFCGWLWVFWYSYTVYFSPRIAGEFFAKRLTILGLLAVGCLILGGIGAALS